MKKLSLLSGKMNLLAIVMGIIMIMYAQSAVAQKKVSIELRGGGNYATQKLGNTSLDIGYGFEGILAYRFISHLAVYAGWSWNDFSSNQTFEGSKLNFNETGYTFGLQFIHPFKNSKLSYMIKGGGIYNHIETENREGKIINDTGHGFGWQAGAGLAIPIGNRVNLIPEIRYRSLSRDIKLDNLTKAVDLNYLSGSVGLSFSF